MNNRTNDPWEVEMNRTFDQRVRDLNEAPLSLDQVKGKAGKIRRNRRVAVAGGVLAAAAIIVPVAVIGGSDLFDSSSKPPVANPDKNQTEHAEDTTDAGWGYLEGDTVHRPDGVTMTFQGSSYRGGVVLGTTFFGVSSNDETGQLSLDVAGDDVFLTQTTEILAWPVANDEGTAVAYVESDGDLVVATESGETTTVATGLSENAQLIAVTGDCPTGDCRVYVDDDVLGETRAYSTEGGFTVPVPGVIGVQDVTEGGLAAVTTQAQDEGSCGGVYDLTKADYLWQTCDYYLFGLSPDGKYVEASHAYQDGFGHAWTAILDAATGKELYRFESPGNGAQTTSVWQDSEHLLVASFEYEPSEWTIYRIAADGSQEIVLGPTKGSDFEPPYTLLDGH